MANSSSSRAADAAPDPAAFAFRLFGAAEVSAPDKNLLLSPYSVSRALGLAYIGASGETQKAFARVLGLPSPADYAAHERAELSRRTDSELAVANSLWLRSGWEFRAAYEKTAHEDLKAAVFRRDFDAKTLGEINGWTAGATRDRIKKILEKLDPLSAAVLVNAVYFKASWTTRFEPALTAPADFHPTAGAAFKHPFMSRDGTFAYARRDGLQAVSLPYGERERWRMIVVLPSAGTKTPKIDAVAWRALLGEMRQSYGSVKLPRFRFDYSAELSDTLSALGLAVAFDPKRADFSAMAEAHTERERLSISRVVHKTYIEVDETGTEAAAATAVSMPLGGPPAAPFKFIADRPFLFAIIGHDGAEPLFLGAVRDPR
jgi:serpin B